MRIDAAWIALALAALPVAPGAGLAGGPSPEAGRTEGPAPRVGDRWAMAEIRDGDLADPNPWSVETRQIVDIAADGTVTVSVCDASFVPYSFQRYRSGALTVDRTGRIRSVDLRLYDESWLREVEEHLDSDAPASPQAAAGDRPVSLPLRVGKTWEATLTWRTRHGPDTASSHLLLRYRVTDRREIAAPAAGPSEPGWRYDAFRIERRATLRSVAPPSSRNPDEVPDPPTDGGVLTTVSWYARAIGGVVLVEVPPADERTLRAFGFNLSAARLVEWHRGTGTPVGRDWRTQCPSGFDP